MASIRSPKSRSSASDDLDPAGSAWQRAVRWLAAHDRSVHEIRTRLDAVATSPAIIDTTIARLRQLHYLDDERFAHTTAEAAARRGHGSERVRAELTAKGVAEPLVAAAVDAAFSDEPALARRVLTRRFPHPPQRAGERAKAARFLLQRGFPESVVLAILGEGC